MPLNSGIKRWKPRLAQKDRAAAEKYAPFFIFEKKANRLAIRIVAQSRSIPKKIPLRNSIDPLELKFNVPGRTPSNISQHEIDVIPLLCAMSQVRNDFRLRAHFPQQFVFSDEVLSQTCRND